MKCSQCSNRLRLRFPGQKRMFIHTHVVALEDGSQIISTFTEDITGKFLGLCDDCVKKTTGEERPRMHGFVIPKKEVDP